MGVPKEKIDITHHKLYNSLQNYMRITGTKGYFKYSEELEKRILNMKLILKQNESECYTDFNAVYIGLLFPHLADRETLDEQYNIAKIVIAHEVAHLRFTSQQAWNNFTSHAQGKYRNLARYAIDILNIIEDGRIEYHMGKVSNKIKRGFKYLRYLVAEDIEKNIKELNKKELEITEKLHLVLYSILYMVSSLRIPTLENKEVQTYVDEIYKLVLYSRKTTSTKKAVQVTEKILDILSPLRETFEEEVDEKMKGHYSETTGGSREAMEDEDLEELEEFAPEETEEFPKEIEELMEMLETEAKRLMEEKTETDSEIVEMGSDGEEDFGTKITKETEAKELPDDETSEKTAKKDKTKGVESKEDKSDDDIEATKMKDKTESSKESTEKKGEIMDAIKEMFEKQKEEMKEKWEEEMKEIESEYKEPITVDIINDFLFKDSKKEKKEEKITERKLKELDVAVDPSIHGDCEVYFKPKREMQIFDAFEYHQIAEQIMGLAKKTAKELQAISNYHLESTLRFQRRGRLDRRSIVNVAAFKEPKAFRKKQLDVQQMDMNVLLLVDASGSKHQTIYNPKNDVNMPRYEMDRIVSIFLHETLKRAKFEHAIWWFDEKFGTKINRFSPMITFNSCMQKNAGYALKDISAYENNRDGFSVAYAGEYLSKHGTSENKLLLVLSDGLPEANGYSGSEAHQDVKNAVQQLEKSGVKTIGIYTGEENDPFKQMYEHHLFIDNETLFDMPKILKNVLIETFKEQLASK